MKAICGPKGRWATLTVWLLIAALLNMLLPQASSQKNNALSDFDDRKPSVQAEQLLEREFPSGSGVPALLTWHRASGITEDDLKTFQLLAGRLSAEPLPHQAMAVPLDQMPLPALKAQLSEDGTTFIQVVLFQKEVESAQLRKELAVLSDKTASLLSYDPTKTAIGHASGLSLRYTGPVGIAADASGLFSSADISLLIATVLLVLVFLLLIYRSPILALIPLVAVGFAYGATSPLLGWMAQQGWITFDSQALSIMTVLLFGAGTDYCLFLISRFRSELKQEADKWIALRCAISGSSGAIAMSGLTVVISLLALLLAQYGPVHRFAVPFSLVIFIMMIASLTLVPALLSLFGRMSFYPFVPRTEEMQIERAKQKGRPVPDFRPKRKLGDRLGEAVVRRPWPITMITLVLLGIGVVFAGQIKFTYDTLSSFPASSSSREGFALIAEHYNPGELAPVKLMVHHDGLRDALEGLPYVSAVSEPRAGANDPSLYLYELQLAENPYSAAAMDQLPQLRRQVEQLLSSAGGGGAAGAAKDIRIAGQTAAQVDIRDTTARDAQVIIPVIIAMIAVLLLSYLRSITATVYLILTVLLSYFSALGFGWAALHYGFGVEAIQGLIPLYAFVFIVALGEDYNIFMVSSIWKKSREMPLKQAIKEGVSQTGGVITSAGVILAGTFAVLTTLPIQILVQFGAVTAIGILLDTFIVRPFLVPALTALLGRRAFWPAAFKEKRALSAAAERE